MSEYKCSKCGYIWIARVLTAPKQCPRCKRYGYDNEDIHTIKKEVTEQCRQ